jgi:regulatory protein
VHDNARAVELALRALARRDHSAAELDGRLERVGFSEAARRDAVDRLVGAGYVDDARFAERRAELLAERGFGDEAIRLDLERRGLDRERVEQALSFVGPEPERARRVAGRSGGGARAARALARKGFSPDTIELVAPDARTELGYEGTI